jgi:hypothetical protein
MANGECGGCGAPLGDAALACPHCGRPQSRTLQVDLPRRQWELGAVIAALIGLLALFVSGYTAWIQREQVRAQVWPHLLIGYTDPERQIIVMNKGVGPALVESVQVTVGGKPQRNWTEVFDAMGMKLGADGWQQSTLNGNVLSPGDKVSFMSLPTQGEYQQFRALEQAGKRVLVRVCYCSTLGECWMHQDHQVTRFATEQVASCPKLKAAESFQD